MSYLATLHKRDARRSPSFQASVSVVMALLAVSSVAAAATSSQAPQSKAELEVSGTALPLYAPFSTFLVRIAALHEELAPIEFDAYLENRGIPAHLPVVARILDWQRVVETDQASSESSRQRSLGRLFGELASAIRLQSPGQAHEHRFIAYLRESARSMKMVVGNEERPFAALEARRQEFWDGAAEFGVSP